MDDLSCCSFSCTCATVTLNVKYLIKILIYLKAYICTRLLIFILSNGFEMLASGITNGEGDFG